ncbi:low temperature requirement protein A [Streptosporangiaceae bacterium NEAU-GS5]|nr:low temperature requirement protein A [Streptosporangiaceae bacterium NEAU-GS5]
MRLPSWFAERIEPVAPDEELRVSSLELFFDLVFVFTVTQLTTLVVADFSWGSLQALAVFGALWWMYSGYVWLTNAVPPTRPARKILLIGGMAGFLLVALAIPAAFDGGGVLLAVGYLIVVLIHAALYLQATAAFIRVLPFNLVGTALLFAAGLTVEPWRALLWVAAVVLLWTSPYFIGQKGFALHPGHIVERHAALVIIVLGESLLAIGIGINGHVDPWVIPAAVLSIALVAGLWWAYFVGDEEAARHALLRVDVVRRTQLILGGFYYGHVPLLMGMVAVAAGIKKAVSHPYEGMPAGPAIALAVGVTLFLLGDAWFRRALGLPPAPNRAVAALLALAAIPIGLWSAIAELGVLVALLAAALAMEQRPTLRT